MKRYRILFFIGICFALTTNATEKQRKDSNIDRFIEVVGHAEMSVSPDTLTLSICIRERENEKNKKKLAVIETELLQDLKKLGFKKEDLKVADFGGVWRPTNSKENKMEYFLTKTFRLKVSSVEQVDQILANTNRDAIDYIQISSLSNKKIKEYQAQTRAEALVAAREKAEYLLKSQGKELGEILFIIELENNEQQPFAHRASNVLLSYKNGEVGDLNNFRQINLHYRIKVRFEIK